MKKENKAKPTEYIAPEKLVKGPVVDSSSKDEDYPEFDQEAYDEIFKNMAKDGEFLSNRLQSLKYKEFPAGIKRQIRAHLVVIIISTIAFAYLSYIAIKNKMNYWSSFVFYIIILFYLLLKLRLIYLTAEIKDFVVFSGVVISVEQKGLLQSKYHIVKLTDGDRIINFRYNGDKKIQRGLPVSLYIDNDTDIRKTEDGLMIDHILGIEFSDVETDEDVMGSSEKVKAEDFFKI